MLMVCTPPSDALQTADATPNGGHCEFDEQDFVSGVQLLQDKYARRPHFKALDQDLSV